MASFIQEATRPRGIQEISVGGHKIRFNADNRLIGMSYIMGRGFEEAEKSFFASKIRPGMIIADIGANIGDYSVVAARHTGQTGAVYAFEPDPENYRLLLENIGLNGYRNIFAFETALTDRIGKLRLYKDGVDSGNQSISERNVMSLSGSFEVRTDTLDNFAASHNKVIDLIKLDTQGAEGLILGGATNVLKHERVKLLLEFWPFGLKNCHTDALGVLKFIQDHRFRLSIIKGKSVETSDINYIMNMFGSEIGEKGFVDLYCERE